VWIPRFACSDCGLTLDPDGRDGSWSCSRCGTRITRRDNLFDGLSGPRAAGAEAFAAQYRTVRAGDGFRRDEPQYYRMLPCVAQADPRSAEWRIRRESYATLRRQLLPDSWQRSIRIADLGAGSGWLAHKLVALGHSAVAVDRLDDDVDGLGACRHYPVSFPAVRADFDALPFEPEQFDMVVFNASLHYSPDPRATLDAAHRLLVPGGVLVVMDSPMFHDAGDGRQMVAAELCRFAGERAVASPERAGAGFLTFSTLNRAATHLRRTTTFTPSRGPLGWRVRRAIGRIRLGRAPAAFGVWVAR
jgi:SAM-dependent methyltransferase